LGRRGGGTGWHQTPKGCLGSQGCTELIGEKENYTNKGAEEHGTERYQKQEIRKRDETAKNIGIGGTERGEKIRLKETRGVKAKK